MEARIIDRPAMTVVGISLHTSFKDERHKREIPPFFHMVLEGGRLDRLPSRVDRNQMCVFELRRGRPDFVYTMGVEVAVARDVPGDMVTMELPPSRYVAVRTIKRGPDDVSRAFEFIFQSWLPASRYVPAGAPAFMYYDESFFEVFDLHGYAGNPEATLFVPIRDAESVVTPSAG